MNAGGGLRIERARVRDALPLLALRREVLAEKQWFVTLPAELSTTLEAQEQQVRDLERSENSALFVARDRSVLVGMLGLYGGALSRTRHTAKLEMMVAKAARGHGVGDALLAEALGWADRNPWLRKLGLTVFAENQRALALYTKHGFREEGRREGEYLLEDGRAVADVLLYRWVQSG